MTANRPATLLEVHRLRLGLLSEAEAAAVRARLERFGDPTSGLPTVEQARVDQPKEVILGAIGRHQQATRRRAVLAVGMAAAAAFVVMAPRSMREETGPADEGIATATEVVDDVGDDALEIGVPVSVGPGTIAPPAAEPESSMITEQSTPEARDDGMKRPAQPPFEAVVQRVVDEGSPPQGDDDPVAPANALVATVHAVDGDVRWMVGGSGTGASLAVGDAIVPGATAVEPGASVSVVWTDGTLVATMSPSRWSWLASDRIALQLHAGHITVEAAEQPAERPLIITSPHALVEVLGTRFAVAVGEASSTVTVEEGRVSVTRRGDGAVVVVGAGQTAVVGDPAAGPLVLGEVEVEGADVPPAPSEEAPPSASGSVDLFSTFDDWRSGEPTGRVETTVIPRGLWRPEPGSDLALPLVALDLDEDEAKGAGKAFAWRVDGMVYVNQDAPHPDRTKRYGQLHVAHERGVFTDRHCYWMRGYWCELRVILLDLDSGRTAVVKKPQLVRWLKQVPSLEVRFEAERTQTPETLHRYLLELLRARPDIVDF